MENQQADPYNLPPDASDQTASSGFIQATHEVVTPRRRGPWMLVASAVAVLALVGGGGFLALQAFTSTSQAPATAMPPNAAAYFSIDLFQLTGEDTTGALIDTVQGVLQRLGEDVQDPEDLIADLDAELQASAGFDFTNDIRPWMGRTIGVGVLSANWDPTDYYSTPDVLIALEVRSESKAKEFLEVLRVSLARDGFYLSDGQYLGIDLLTAEDAGESVTVGVSDGMLLAGTTRAVYRGIDAQRGASLADNTLFVDATDELPESRLLTGWVDARFYQNVYEDMLNGVGSTSADVDAATDLMAGWEGAALAVTVTEQGIAFDGVALIDEGQVPDWYSTALNGSGSVPSLLPADTLAFFEYGSPAQIWSSTASTLFGTTPELQEEIDGFEDELGFHPIDDFVAFLDGSLGIAMLRSQDGMLAAETGYPIGLVGFAGTSSPDPLRATLEDLNRLLSQEGIQPDTVTIGTEEFYVYEDGGEEVVAYGVTEERLLVGTSSRDLVRVGAGGPDLTTNPAYRTAVEALGGDGYSVAFFADIAGLTDVFGATGDVRVALEPFNAVVGASRVSGSRYQGSVLVLIDYD
jgi:hypothetical protein